jgi:hypothetical protein
MFLIVSDLRTGASSPEGSLPHSDSAEAAVRHAEELLADGDVRAARKVIAGALDAGESHPDLLWALADVEFAHGDLVAGSSRLIAAVDASGRDAVDTFKISTIEGGFFKVGAPEIGPFKARIGESCSLQLCLHEPGTLELRISDPGLAHIRTAENCPAHETPTESCFLSNNTLHNASLGGKAVTDAVYPLDSCAVKRIDIR